MKASQISFKYLVLTLTLFSVTISQAQDFKVVGYLPTYRQAALDNLNYDFYTHIVASFINPDADGNMSWNGDIENFVTKTHSAGALAIVSFGGGGDFSWGSQVSVYENLLSTAASRTAFIHKIMNYLREHNLDGIDNDMEGQALALSTYNAFTQELADSVHAAGLEISAAYGVEGNWGGQNVTTETLEKLDFVATMSYGGVGAWNWQLRENYHTFEKFESDMNYFIDRGMDPSKVIGGLAYYTNEYPATAQSNYSQFNRTICNTYQDARLTAIDVPNQDTIYTEDGSVIYQNSLNTFKRKVALAAEKNSGIMIWEVGQECFDGSIALTDTLYEYLASLGPLYTIEDQSKVSFQIFPNPGTTSITIQGENLKEVKIISIQGILIETYEALPNHQIMIDTFSLAKDVYIIEAVTETNMVSRQQFVKQ